MTLAKRVKNTIQTECPNTFSLYAGYGIKAGKPIHYPTGIQLKEKRNENGRVIMALYQYADDSILKYTYNTRTSNYKLDII